jgi:prepilin-type processing-associated H-X9-DG protein
MLSRTHQIAICGFALALATVGPATAHHSGAMFDSAKSVDIVGTVKAWQFINPHAWLQVVVDADGKSTQWSFEGASSGGGGVSSSSRLAKDTFKPGDKVTVKTHPMKDGRPAGTLSQVTFADGHVWPPARPATE